MTLMERGVSFMKKLNVLWWVAIIIGIIGLLMHQDVVSISGVSSFWVEVAALGIMAIAGLMK